MRYQLLGPSGLRVSEICLGTMSFGDAWGFGADEKESHRILDAFADAGGNFIDTANKYHEGQTEEIVGASWARDATAGYWRPSTRSRCARSDPNAAGNSRKNMRESVEASLRRLRTDYLDVLWVHAWDYATPVRRSCAAWMIWCRRGKVNYVGLSDAPAWIASQANTLAAMRGWSPVRRTADPIQPDRAHGGAGAAAGGGGVRPVGHGLGADGWRGANREVHARSRGQPCGHQRAAGNQQRLTERNLRIGREVDRVADETRHDIGAGGDRLGTAARPSGSSRSSACVSSISSRMSSAAWRWSCRRSAVAPRRGQSDRARVPVRPPARARGANGLRRPRTPDRPTGRGTVQVALGRRALRRRPVAAGWSVLHNWPRVVSHPQPC